MTTTKKTVEQTATTEQELDGKITVTADQSTNTSTSEDSAQTEIFQDTEMETTAANTVEQTATTEQELDGKITVTADQSTNTDTDTSENSEKTVTLKVAIIIPYLKKKAQGAELLYAIRSIAKNFTDDFQLVVIGDKEDWFGDDILFIEHACIGSNPQADVLDKVRHIIADERIGENFVWSNDDIYFVAPTSLADIQVLKTIGLLQSVPGGSLYGQNKDKTIAILTKAGAPVRNFDTHMPFFFEKTKMADVFDAFPEMGTDGLLMASMYFNLHNDASVPADSCNWESDPWMLRIVSKLETEEKKKTFRSLIGKKHFLNNSEAGYSTLLMNWLDRKFPEKCRFEK